MAILRRIIFLNTTVSFIFYNFRARVAKYSLLSTKKQKNQLVLILCDRS
jgi:hypothetical protein